MRAGMTGIAKGLDQDLRTAAAAIAGRPWLWVSITLGAAVAYYAALMAAMVFRFGNWPNYAISYDIVEAYRLILIGTPDLRDAARIMAAEAVFEAGYMNPIYRIAEWNLSLLPAKMALVLLFTALAATFTVLALPPRGQASRRIPSGTNVAAAGLGTACGALGGATLMWVVCCSYPSWVVALAMMGVGVSVALALEPFGPALNLIGLAVLGFAVLRQARLRHAVEPGAAVRTPRPVRKELSCTTS